MPLLHSPIRKPLLLSKLILAPTLCSYLATAFFTAFMSKQLDTKKVISSANVDTFSERGSPREIPHRAGLASSSLSLRSRGSKARTYRKGDRGQPCRTERSITKASKRFLFTCTTVCGLWYIMLIYLPNSDWNSAVSKTVAKNRWSTQSKALDWFKLISTASVPSFNSSWASRTKCKLSWIDLPFTA